jgi:hypothetical protein
VSQDYVNSAGQTGRFTDAQFLVFVNRILAFAVALVVIMLRHQPVHKETRNQSGGSDPGPHPSISSVH